MGASSLRRWHRTHHPRIRGLSPTRLDLPRLQARSAPLAYTESWSPATHADTHKPPAVWEASRGRCRGFQPPGPRRATPGPAARGHRTGADVPKPPAVWEASRSRCRGFQPPGPHPQCFPALPSAGAGARWIFARAALPGRPSPRINRSRARPAIQTREHGNYNGGNGSNGWDCVVSTVAPFPPFQSRPGPALNRSRASPRAPPSPAAIPERRC